MSVDLLLSKGQGAKEARVIVAVRCLAALVCAHLGTGASHSFVLRQKHAHIHMPLPTKLKPLTKLIQQLGYPEPEAFAQSVIDEGPHQLLAALFVHQAWKWHVVPDGDVTWIDREIASAAKRPNEPYAGLGLALKRCREAGVEDKHLIEMARCHQAATIFRICYLLGDPGFDDPELEDVAWGLFQVDENDRPVGQALDALHELVLGSDPTGREMRPSEDLFFPEGGEKQ